MPSDDFFLEEERCGHIVTSEMKKVWSVQISCLEQLKRICEKYNIRYYAGAGTLLGAVRHSGYIPWDDDLDVFMLEEDYVRFCQIAPNELENPFFFQNYKTQKGFGPSLSRIRRSDTTGCTEYEKNIADAHYNCGIFIDIFPLFSVNSNKLARSIRELPILKYKAALAGFEHWKKQQKQGKKFDLLILYWKIMSIFMDHEKMSSNFLNACSSKKKDTTIVAPVSFTGYRERFLYDRKWFEYTMEMPFEYTTISCPSCYDQMLRRQYGDYMVFKKGTAMHSMAIVDTETPYIVKLGL